MPANKTLMLLPGDGIGPEVTDEVKRTADGLAKHRAFAFDVREGLVGGACYDAHGCALQDKTLADSKAADAVILGAVGGPKWDGGKVAREHRPEAGLLALRKELGLFANLRPAVAMPALVHASTLKPEVVSGLDIMIVRELTGGVYFGQPRGRFDLEDGTPRALDTQVYTKPEIERIGRVAFDLARKRDGRVTSVEKANVMETGVFWREVMAELHAAEGEGVALENMYADNCAMQLVRDPKQFDVIVTDNLFGDLLSDCAAMLTGSLGMLPSASLGARDETGKTPAMYEPVHGSAPDIAGEGKANPLAMILSFAMCLRYSFDLDEDADLVEAAVAAVLDAGLRTPDIMQSGMKAVSTAEMGEAVVAAIAARA
ncbi:MAG: 3-isopropylmalate dehydrogenase [Rhodospirillales bacterium]